MKTKIKRVLSILALVLVVLTVSVALILGIYAATAETYGDVNGDGKLDSADIVYMVRTLANWKGYSMNESQETLADVNLSGSFDAADAVVASRHLAGWSGYDKFPAQLLEYEENFDGTSFSDKKWGKCPEWERGNGVSIWDDDMSYLDGNGHLVLRAEWDAANSRVKCGAVRTAVKSSSWFGDSYTYNKYGLGYYEASIKFPLDVRNNGNGPVGIWTSFWMMCGDVENVDGSSADGVEIDIIESIYSHKGAYNSAMYWDGYGDDKKQSHTGHMYKYDIYDGNYHVIALERTENENIFYIDGKETWRVTNGDKATYQDCYFTQCTEDGYMKLTIEGAEWAYKDAGLTQADMIASIGDGVEMVVDYVRVFSENPYR